MNQDLPTRISPLCYSLNNKFDQLWILYPRKKEAGYINFDDQLQKEKFMIMDLVYDTFEKDCDFTDGFLVIHNITNKEMHQFAFSFGKLINANAKYIYDFNEFLEIKT